MSRIGNKVVVLPADVEVEQDENSITVKRPKGELAREPPSSIKIGIEGNEVTFTRPNDSRKIKTVHGTARANFSNMVAGVPEGFQKTPGLIRVGYRVQIQGNELILSVGYSHPVEMTISEGAIFEVPANTRIIVKDIDKEVADELVASTRGVRPPESYKGRGIRYVGEFVRRKEGKADK